MIEETLTLRFETAEQQERFHALLNSDIGLNLDRAYRALCGYAMASESGMSLPAAARAYHSPTVAAAKRWVIERGEAIE